MANGTIISRDVLPNRSRISTMPSESSSSSVSSSFLRYSKVNDWLMLPAVTWM